MVPTASRRVVIAAAIALAVVALYGAYKGFRTATVEADVAAATDPETEALFEAESAGYTPPVMLARRVAGDADCQPGAAVD
mgnify:CR=1 FL=1